MGSGGNKLRYLFPKGAARRLQEQGYVGQEQTPVVFVASKSIVDHVDLSGLGGEKPEFFAVQWMSFADLLSKIPSCKAHIIDLLSQVVPAFVKANLAETKATSPSSRKRPREEDAEVDAEPTE